MSKPDRAASFAAGKPVTSRDNANRTATVLVGLDGSSTSWDAFWWACGEVKRLDGHLVAVFVSSTAEANIAITAGALGAPLCDCRPLEMVSAEKAGRLQAEAQRHCEEQGFALSFVHAHGDAAKELLRVAEALSADMIVVGRSTKVQHHLAGSIGKRLISKQYAPVVTVVP